MTAHDDVAELTSKAVVAIDELTIHYDAAAYACAEGDLDEVLHAACSTIGHLTDGGSVGIIGHGDGYTDGLLELFCQGYDTLPRQVGRVLDVARVVVAIGGADAHALDLLGASHGLDHRHQLLGYGCHIFTKFLVRLSLDRVDAQDIATSIDDTEYGVCAADIHAHYIRSVHNGFNLKLLLRMFLF